MYSTAVKFLKWVFTWWRRGHVNESYKVLDRIFVDVANDAKDVIYDQPSYLQIKLEVASWVWSFVFGSSKRMLNEQQNFKIS